jgi:hypothetical protein
MAYVDEVLADSPAGYWRMGEALDSSPANDETANNNDGVYTNVTGTTPGQAGISGDGNTAVRFTKASLGYVAVPDAASLDLGGNLLTLEAWVKLAAVGAAQLKSICSKGANGYQMRVNTADKIELLKDRVGVLATSVLAITDTNWHHIVGTKNGATRAIYIDGAESTSLGVDAVVAATDNSLYIAVANGAGAGVTVPEATTYMDGTLDEIAVYPTALSAARVLAHFQAAVVPSESGANAGAFVPAILQLLGKR